MIGEDGMTLVYVPEGEFTMGSENREQDERPEHRVYLDAFWIDQTEVTNAMYAKCVADDVCESPLKTTSNTRERYHGNRDFNDFPVNYISWSMAKTYCKWAGRDLPTEAQWEKAARGTDGREFPWGNSQISAALLNYKGSNLRDTTKVGAYPQGESPYGALDMAGNSFEWVNDWYSSTYYQESSPENPTGPISGQARVVRGGAWGYEEKYARTAYRNFFPPDGVYNFGFRCALSP
jgi:formylglycine-generating enzyme required for sulfatase activity